MIALQGMADVWIYSCSQRMPHHPQGDPKLLQLETLQETKSQSTKVKVQKSKYKSQSTKEKPDHYKSEKARLHTPATHVHYTVEY